jgi:hypothetical protein
MNVVVLHRVSIGDVDRLVVADQIDKDVGEAERSSTAENDGGGLVVDGDVGDDLEEVRRRMEWTMSESRSCERE